MWLVVIVILLAAALAWFVHHPSGKGLQAAPGGDESNDIDHDQLEQAEREVQEAESPHEVRDWGPGAPKSESHPPGE